MERSWRPTRGRGRGRGGRGRPYQRPAEPSGPGNAPLLPPQQQQWPGQMNGQERGPNTERNRQRRKEQNARKKAFQAQSSSNVHMAHMMEYDDPDMIQDERDEEQIKNNNLVEDLGPDVFLGKYKIEKPEFVRPKMIPLPREPGYIVHRRNVAEFAAK